MSTKISKECGDLKGKDKKRVESSVAVCCLFCLRCVTGHSEKRRALLGIVSEGRAVKQWQKLIQLGIQHLFHRVLISEEIKEDTVTPEMFEFVLKELGASPEETVFVGNRLDTDILYANKAGIISVRMRKGEHRVEEPKSPEMTPKYEISKISEIFNVLKN